MALLLNNGSVFLHIPKTGGSWVTHVLEELNLATGPVYKMHSDLDELYWYNRFYPLYPPHRMWKAALKHPFNLKKVIRDGFKFCFVRHPLRWYESYWKFQEQQGWEHWGQPIRGLRNWHPNACLHDIQADNFHDFVARVLAKYPGYVTTLYQWYTSPGIDFVGKQENLTEDLHRALNSSGLSVSLRSIQSIPRVNQSRPPKEKLQWDPELKSRVLDSEQLALKRYGYSESP
jgi:hypothetical protein